MQAFILRFKVAKDHKSLVVCIVRNEQRLTWLGGLVSQPDSNAGPGQSDNQAENHRLSRNPGHWQSATYVNSSGIVSDTNKAASQIQDHNCAGIKPIVI